jgi:transcriptional regulator with XRE-family HTH domain
MEDIRIRFGKHLRKIREGKGLTQEGLADLAGLHFTYIGQIERGKRNPSLVNLERLAKALKIDASKLFPF